MERFELIAPCHFGLEAVMKREILDLGYEVSQVEDGRVTFIGDAEAVCRANIFLRTTERILLKVGSFKAETFEELFQGTRVIPWEQYIPRDGKFWVAKASSIKSRLFSPSDIQSIMKKAMVERMKGAYGITWFPEDGASYPLRVFLYKDVVTVAMDTSGDSLHKRGYRTLTSKAPITETLAAALLMLTPWKPDRILVDPFCGSGTFPIEAAMMAANMAPGMNRGGILFLSHFNREVLLRIIRDAELEFVPLFTARPHLFVSIDHPLANRESVTLEELRSYPRLVYEQGLHNSFYFSEEPHSTAESPKNIVVTDRATLFNLLVGLGAYTISSGIIHQDATGSKITSVPLESDEIMQIGYLHPKDQPLSRLGQRYLELLQPYLQQ